MPRFSANLGFLWTDRPLPEAILAAGRAGFDAVECHFPYEYPTDEITAALDEVGLPMLSLNTALGVNGPDDLGVAARTGRESEARRLIDEAVAYAAAIGCANVHVVAGLTERADPSEATYRQNLDYACRAAAAHDITVLIEPLSAGAAPGYHCSTVEQAVRTIVGVDRANLKIMFDCFHVQSMTGRLAQLLVEHLALIGHVQIAAVPDRGEPDAGEVNYPWLFDELDRIGYAGWVGAEYTPRSTIDAGLGWLAEAKRSNERTAT